MKISRLLSGAALIAATAGTAALAEYPEKPIEVIVPFGAGSNSDTSGRLLINAMRKAMDADLVPINVDGAGGTIGIAQMARSKPDGYRIGYAPIATVTVQPNLRPLPYDETSLAPVCMVADNPTAISVAPDSPYNSIQELIDAARAGEQIIAVGGAPGSMPHITQAALANAYGVTFTYLPAGGGGKAATALLGGEATLAADAAAMVSQYDLKALAIASAERTDMLPDVPTLAELGHDVSLSVWFGLFAPKDTPVEVLDQLSSACGRAVEDPDFVKGMTAANYTLRYLDRTAFADFYEQEYARSRELLPTIGVKARD
ncbi:tripartite tricarboxylate transporter substrate binding protein [Paracoccus seriniphilus]|uniref:Tripartite-type tricarboxylate transporter, receptor component TctC n=1 Tax=Paracoccus seriniphilus TaxID=184748 RepID=A0A239PUE0_9RHOB|nr:tripartite tricarboxylate transporter substrate binding protein [Paracoccus seriniphilus]WCR16482.1 tripartite tricarboxylate transporter substrate binding protein [Paracoccus seriniphilus]SNT73643.1 Tripartite-type tricarboxylate transporter, receptor component TctC [Paracoccus seriniphilus]